MEEILSDAEMLWPMDDTIPSSLPALVVYVAAPEDEVWRASLDKQLASLQRYGALETWSPHNVSPGGYQDQEVSARIASASIVILLLSSDYMASDQCYRWQQQALARGDVTIVPVLIRSVNLQGSPVADLTLLPHSGQAVTLASDKDAALQEIAREICAVIDPAGADRFHGSLAGPEESARAEELAWRANFLPKYRAEITADTAITELQILDMSAPLSVADVYVKVHLHRQPRARASEDEKESHDPTAYSQQQESQLEKLVRTSVDPEIVVKSHKYCVVLGDPGAGKTTLLLRLAEQQIVGLPVIPIYLKLHELAQQEAVDIFQAALTSVCGYGFLRPQTERSLMALMEEGKVLLLLDALDETVVGVTSLAAKQAYQNVVEAIQQIKKRFQGLRIVVTSRKAEYFSQRQLQGFTELEVLDFLPREIEQFIRKWYQVSREAYWQQSADTLIQDLRKKSRLTTLAANPLLLTLIIITYKNNSYSLPKNRAQLYKKCVQTLLNVWDNRLNVTQRPALVVDVNDQERLLPRIAWHFHQQGLRYFPEAKVLPIIAEYLAELGRPEAVAPQALAEMTSKNGLLREQATGYYGFLHLTIQEYFAAVYSENKTDELLTHLGDSWWEEVILLSAGTTQDAGPLLQHLVTTSGDNEIPEDIFFSKLILAGRYLAAQPPISQAYRHLRQEIPERLLSTALDCSYTIVLEPLTEALAEIGRTFANDNNDTVNEGLLELLADEAISQRLKGYLLLALGTYGSKTLAAPLLTMFKQGQFAWIPAMLSTERLPFDLLEITLGSLCDTSQLFSLFEMLGDDSIFTSTNVDGVTLIGRIGGEATISRLIRLLENTNTDWLIRSAIPRVLGLYGTKTVVMPTLIKWLRDPDLANYCADGLLLLNDAAVGDKLVAVLSQKEISALTRSYIALLLTQVGDDNLVSPLMRLFEDLTLEEDVRAAIAHTLVIIGDEKIRWQLINLVADSRVSDQTSREIVQAFSSVEENTTIAQLHRLEEVPTLSTALRQDIVQALGILGDPIALTMLIQALQQTRSEVWDEDIQIAIPIIVSIVRYGTLDQIKALLYDAQYASQVRIRLLDYLPDLALTRQQNLIYILIDIISNRTIIESVRHGAIWALGQIGNTSEVIERLIACLPGSNSTDEIYRALWRVSRRAGVRIVPVGPGGMQLHIWKW